MAKEYKYRVIHSPARARAGRCAWILYTPAQLSPSGKKKMEYFATEREAKRALVLAESARAQFGHQVRDFVTDRSQQIAWQHDRALAESADLSTSQAIGFAVQCVHEFGSLEKALELARWAKGRAMQAFPEVSLAEALDEYVADCTHCRHSTFSIKKAMRSACLMHAFALCQNTALYNLDAKIARELLAKIARTDSGKRLYLSHLKALMSWAARKGYIAEDARPLATVKPPRRRESEKVCLTPEQLRTLLRSALDIGEHDCALFFAVAAFSGLRPAECTRIKWGDISEEEDWLSVRPQHSKTGGARHITIRPVLREWLDFIAPPHTRTPSAQVMPGYTLTRFRKCLRAAGIDRWTPDVLRHSFASYGLKAGIPISDIQNDMGHRDLNLLRSRYLNMSGITNATAAEWWSMFPKSLLE